MSKLLAMAVIGIGLTLVLAAIFADPLGVSGGGSGLGWKQLIAAIVGLAIALVGLARFLRPMTDAPTDPREE